MYKWKVLRFKSRKDAEFVRDQRMDTLKYVQIHKRSRILSRDEYLDMLEYDEEGLDIQ